MLHSCWQGERLMHSYRPGRLHAGMMNPCQLQLQLHRQQTPSQPPRNSQQALLHPCRHSLRYAHIQQASTKAPCQLTPHHKNLLALLLLLLSHRLQRRVLLAAAPQTCSGSSLQDQLQQPCCCCCCC